MDVHEAIRTRYSIQSYLRKPVEEDKLMRVLDAARLAPSAGNRQPFFLVVIRDETRRKALGKIYNREWFLSAPVIIGLVADPVRAWKRSDGKNYVDVDAAIAFDHLMLAARQEGLGTHWIGAFDAAMASGILQLPEGMEVLAFTPLGYPSDSLPDKKRRSLDELVHWETW